MIASAVGQSGIDPSIVGAEVIGILAGLWGLFFSRNKRPVVAVIMLVILISFLVHTLSGGK